jgi:hypothetical protein
MEFITIDFSRFHQFYLDTAAEPETEPFVRLVEDLKQRFPCLTTTSTPFSGRGGRGGGHGHGHDHRRGGGGQSLRRNERPRIGVRELSREDISRKDFTANMNKLSRQNYDSILRLIRTTYNSNFLQNYMDIVWSMMLRQVDFQDLHIQVVQHLMHITPPDKKIRVSDYWNQRCRTYFDDKEWTPTDDLFGQNTSDEYDDFCDYIKWKKKTGASLLAWLRLMDAGVIPVHYDRCFSSIIESIQDALCEHNYKYFDCLLEWFLQMVKFGVTLPSHQFPDNIHIILNDWLDVIQEQKLSSALRFRLMDIRECLTNTKDINNKR